MVSKSCAALFFFFLLLFFWGERVCANTIRLSGINWAEVEVIASQSDGHVKTELRPKKKSIAIALAVTLGAFGVHRLYLGTSNKVPIIYTLTLGGGFGVLMVSDIVAIIATKDINTYSPSEKVFMWAK